jgi:hypothetical protein
VKEWRDKGGSFECFNFLGFYIDCLFATKNSILSMVNFENKRHGRLG